MHHEPKDIQDLQSEERSKANVPDHSGDLYAGRHTAATSTDLHKAADLINAGTKVAILAGRGCLNARNEILQLAEAAGAPIAKALLGKAVVPDDSPYTTGGLGLLGTAPSQDALAECDTFIIAGSNFRIWSSCRSPERLTPFKSTSTQSASVIAIRWRSDS